MGLYVSTTGEDVPIPELGITIVHPTIDRDLRSQFTPDEIQYAPTITSKIRDGTLIWKKTSGGSTELPTDYDPDLLEATELNLGVGVIGDRVVTFKDLTGSSGSVIKSGSVAPASFTGTPARKADVTFSTEFSSDNYAVTITGQDGRFWAVESKTAAGFTISTNAAQAITGPVYWIAIYYGEG